MSEEQHRVGRYRLGPVIGVGSFATVHEATDDRLESTVVVKVLAENHSLNPEIRERFIAEGRSLRRVRSPHVVAVHDIGESDRQQPYLVLAHADRGTLAQRVAGARAGGWVCTPNDVLAVARPLAAALAAVHAADLVHRDLSPDNVLLTSAPVDDAATGAVRADVGSALIRPDERLLLSDLGLCKDLALSSGLTVAGGTSGFRPPEQRSTGVVDHRADLWALTSLLRWLVEGSEPAAALRGVLRRGLADEPSRRHPDAASWLADVETALAPAPPVAPPSRRQLLLAVGAGVLGVGAGVGGASLVDRAGTPSRRGGAAVGIEGPDRVRVGEEIACTAVVDGVATWVWTLPDGTVAVDDPAVSVRPTGPGRATFVLRAPDGAGGEVEARHEVQVEA